MKLISSSSSSAAVSLSSTSSLSHRPTCRTLEDSRQQMFQVLHFHTSSQHLVVLVVLWLDIFPSICGALPPIHLYHHVIYEVYVVSVASTLKPTNHPTKWLRIHQSNYKHIYTHTQKKAQITFCKRCLGLFFSISIQKLRVRWSLKKSICGVKPPL